MTRLSRRKLITTGIGAVAGVAGLGAATRLADQYGLIPPDHGGLYGPGNTLTYATQRLLTRHSLAREFDPTRISKLPFANPTALRDEAYTRSKSLGFADWRLTVDGLVASPASFSLDDLRRFPVASQITLLACEEGWSYIAEWTGVPMSHLLKVVGAAPQATYVVYSSIEAGWWDSLDIAEAVHPQTLVTYAMNGADLPTGFGGPLRLRVPRQLGYKSVKYLARLTVTDNIKSFGKGLGSASPEGGYSWYAGI